ncbi:MAG: hypothetical protein ORN23_06755 [Chthoniobacterales bacterium]|nr:hypothetical protein [Chthoniobacterales bacterium]
MKTPQPFQDFPPCPAPGQGRNIWCLEAANACRAEGLPSIRAMEIIRQQLTRDPKAGEIERAVSKAYNADPGIKYPPPICAVYAPEVLERFAEVITDFGEGGLFQKSKVRPDECSPLEFLHAIYAPGERVLMTDEFTKREGIVWERNRDEVPYEEGEIDSLRTPRMGLGVWFLPNPITGEWLQVDRVKSPTNPRGVTMRSEENLTAYRYMVVESDNAPTDLWIKALARLPLPITSISTSGGRSIHALIRVDAKTAQDWQEIKQRIAAPLIKLGADKGALSIVRLTRLPGCYRQETDQWQRLLYLNPAADGTPICNQPDLRPLRALGSTTN